MKLFRRHQPSVIVSDIGLPDEDGCTLLGRIRSHETKEKKPNPVPAIAVSAYTSEEDRKRSLAAGFQLHIGKPIESVESRHTRLRCASMTLHNPIRVLIADDAGA